MRDEPLDGFELLFGVTEAYSGSIRTQKLVLEALDRLPAEVQRFALDCRIVAVGNGLLGFVETDVERIIILSDELTMANPYDAKGIFAHELAHLWLGHGDLPAGMTEKVRMETEAANQAADWGFSGPGTDPGECIHAAVKDFWRFSLDLRDANLDAARLPQLRKWQAGWALVAETAWQDLMNSLSSEQKALWRQYEAAQEQESICRIHAAGYGDSKPQPPPNLDNA